jgi:hypothetical protein
MLTFFARPERSLISASSLHEQMTEVPTRGLAFALADPYRLAAWWVERARAAAFRRPSGAKVMERLTDLGQFGLEKYWFQAVSLWTESLSLHQESGGVGGWRLEIGGGAEGGDRGRDRDAGGLEGGGGVAKAVGAQPIAGAVEVDDHRLELAEIAHEIRPGHGEAFGVEPALQVDLEAQGQEAAGDVADHAVVAGGRSGGRRGST